MPVIYFPAPCFIVLCGCWASSKYLRDIFLNSIFSFHVSVSYLGILKIFQMVPLFCVRYGDLWGFPSGSVVKNALSMQEIQETWVRYLGWEDSLEKEMETDSSILA